MMRYGKFRWNWVCMQTMTLPCMTWSNWPCTNLYYISFLLVCVKCLIISYKNNMIQNMYFAVDIVQTYLYHYLSFVTPRLSRNLSRSSSICAQPIIFSPTEQLFHHPRWYNKHRKSSYHVNKFNKHVWSDFSHKGIMFWNKSPIICHCVHIGGH